MPQPDRKFGPTNAPLDSRSFGDHTNWTSALGCALVSFSNLDFSNLGDDASRIAALNLTASLIQKLLGCRQAFTNDFQIVVAITEFDHQLGQGDQVFDLETQRPAASAAHFLKLRPLILGHADVELECFFRHTPRLPDTYFELMRKYG
jgi:hypothetical protein